MYVYGHHYEVYRGLYWHHGICVDEDRFIHFANKIGDGILNSDNIIHVSDSQNFVRDGNPELIEYCNDDTYPPLKVVARAYSKEGEDGYSLWENNCEHFARWCMIAKSDSLQINFLKNSAKGALTGALLGSRFGPTGVLIGGAVGILSGAILAWFSRKPLLPVYKEFVEYSSALFFSTKRGHPLGKSFRHATEEKKSPNDLRNYISKEDKYDSILVFHYEGSWLFGSKNNWFITERAIIFPHKNIYINFHDVRRIYSSRFKLTIDMIDGSIIKLPSKFINAKAMAKFLHASVSSTPLYESDFRISLNSILKEMLHLLIGGMVITAGVGWFFPAAVPWLVGVLLLVILVSPFSFMDENPKR